MLRPHELETDDEYEKEAGKHVLGSQTGVQSLAILEVLSLIHI